MPRKYAPLGYAHGHAARHPFRRVETAPLQTPAPVTVAAVAPQPPSGTAAIRALPGVVSLSRIAELLAFSTPEAAGELDLPFVYLGNAEPFVTPSDLADFVDDLLASARLRHRADRHDGRGGKGCDPDGPDTGVPQSQ